MSDVFEVFCQGHTIGGYVTFWKSGKYYYRQSVGLGKPKRCSKKLYDEAKALYEKQCSKVSDTWKQKTMSRFERVV